MLKPIGIVNRINYLLKNPHLKGLDLRHVKLNAKKAESAKNFGVNYEIYKNYQMFSRHVSMGRELLPLLFGVITLIKKGL